MSFLNNAFVVPGRLRGVYRYLLREGRPVERDTLAKMISPDSLLKVDPDREAKTRGMVSACIREGVKAGLFLEQDDMLALAPELPDLARDPKHGDASFYLTIADLIVRQGNQGENADLMITAAWLMTLDPRDYAGPWREAERRLQHDGVRQSFGTNDTRWVQFEHWAVAIGLATAYEEITADPTPFLRRRLDDIFGDCLSLSMPEALAAVAAVCPAFDTGWASTQVLQLLPEERRPKPNHLLPATSMAWLRLHEERLVRLEREADSPNTSYLQDGDASVPFSRVHRVGGQ